MEMWSKPLDQAGIDQKTVEPACLGVAGTTVEDSAAPIDIVNDSPADGPGRRSNTSQKKFLRPQAARNMTIRPVPASLQTAIAQASKWDSANGTRRAMRRRHQASSGASGVAEDDLNKDMRRGDL